MPTRLPLCLASLALTLTATTASAAEWTQLPHPASSGYAVYADPATEQPRHNKFVGIFVRNPMQAWFVTDYAMPHRWTIYQILSSKQLLEFDCKHGTVRMLARYYYEGPMMQGRLLVSEPEARAFTRVVPGDPEETMYQSTCARARAQDEPQQASQQHAQAQAMPMAPVVAPPDAAPPAPVPPAPP